MSPEGVVAVVTGGGSGLGRATAVALRDAGATVVSVDRTRSDEEEEGIHRFAADVCDPGGVAAAVSYAGDLGELRVCVNCAGILRAGPVARDGEAGDLGRFRLVVNVNLVGTFNVTSLAAARMQTLEPLDGERGVIVNTSSVAAYDGQVGMAAYAASKAAVAGMTLPIARDLGDSLIRCVAIAPGIFATPMLGPLRDDGILRTLGTVPHPRRPGEPSEFASLVLHVVRNQMLNGEVIRLDGAVRLPPS